MMKKRIAVMLAVGTFVTTLGGEGRGEYSTRFELNRSASASRALDGRQVPVWRVSQDIVLRDLGTEILERAKAATSATNWHGNISRTSASGELWRTKHDPGPSHWTETNRPKLNELEATAYWLATDILAPLIVPQGGEELVPWMLVHQIGASRSETGETKTRLLSSTVKFARVLDGVPVLGSDSYVALTFAPDGSLIGVAYSWPSLERTNDVPTVKRDVLLDRAQRVSRMRGERGVRDSVDCGYYPAAGHDEYLPACLITYRDESGVTPTLWLDVVPLSEAIDPSLEWTESKALASTRAL